MTKKGLGKGLEALFSDNIVEISSENKNDGVVIMRIGDIEPNRAQPRHVFDEEKIEQLTQSIIEHGVIQPLIVRPSGNGTYQIVAGERRWRAARKAKLSQIPVIVREFDDRQAAEVALVENLQREDLNPMEEAAGYQTLMEMYAMTQDEVAKRVGRSRPAVTNALRLLQLPDDVAKMLEEGTLSAGHARALLPLGEQAGEAALKVISDGLSVRATENLVKNRLKHASKQKPSDITVNYYNELAKRISSTIGRKVSIVPGQKKGKIEIEYYSSDDLEQLSNQILNNLVK